MGGVIKTDENAGVTAGTITGATYSVESDGSFTYRVPIWVSPGRQGMQPNLAFTYSSRGTNGLMGIGWTIDGLSRIAVGPRSVSHDGAEGPVRFDGQDAFYLDDQRLMCVAGTHGEVGAEYRTDHDRFAKIVLRQVDVAEDGTVLGPAWFEVFLRDGRILTYGERRVVARTATLTGTAIAYSGPSVAVQAPVIGDPAADPIIVGKAALENTIITVRPVRYAWLLASIRDRNGNTLDISYVDAPAITGREDEIEKVPDAFVYGASTSAGLKHTRSVVLSWEPRPDPRYHWVSGLKIGQSVRLTAVTCVGPKGSKSASLRRYELTYRNDSVSQRSLLASITESDQFGVRKTPHRFDWELGASSFTEIDAKVDDIKSTTSGRASLPGRIRVADFNADGRDDVLYIPNSDLNRYWILPSDRQSPTLFGAQFPTGIVTPQAIDGGRPYLVPAPDRAAIDILSLVDNAPPGTPGIPTYRFWRAGLTYAGGYQVGGSFNVTQQPPVYSVAGTVQGIVEIADLDGDGLADLLHSDLSGGVPQWYVRFNLGDNVNFTNESFVGAFAKDHYLLQLRGGLATSILVDSPSLNPGAAPVLTSITTSKSDRGTLRSANVTTLISGQGYIFGDLFGTGLPSAFSPGYSNASDPSITENVGGTFAMPQYLNLNLQNPPSQFTPLIRPMDWDQDGIQELLIRPRSVGQEDQMLVLKWNGAEFDAIPLDFKSIFRIPSEFELFEVFDSNGNGLDDIVMFSDGSLRVFVRDGKRADMMTGVTDGLGAMIAVEYAPISDPDVHTPMGQYVYPQRNISAKIWAVNQVQVSDGIGGVRTNRYSYQSAVEDVTGAGFLGFAIVTREDVETGETIQTSYDLWTRSLAKFQAYPLRGIPAEVVRTTPLPNGRKQVETTTTNPVIQEINGGSSYFVYAGTVDTQIRELENGAGVAPDKTRHETRQCDNFGNIIEYELVCGDTNRRGFSASYDNDEVNWLIGLRTKFIENSTAPGKPTGYRHRTFDYDGLGQMILEVIEPPRKSGGPRLTVPNVAPLYKVITYDEFGNVTEVTEQTSLINPAALRLIRYKYDPDDYQCMVRFEDSLGHGLRFECDRGLGRPVSLTGDNGAVTIFSFDGYGRERETSFPDGSDVRVNYEWLASGYAAVAKTKTGAQKRFTYDCLSRVSRSEELVRNDSKVVVREWIYDQLGYLVQQSLPRFQGAAPVYSYFNYDLLGRLVDATLADSSSISIYRTGYWATLKGASSFNLSLKLDDLGRIVFATDRDSALIGTPAAKGSVYSYEAFDKVASITDIVGDAISFTHDVLGRITSIEAPDQVERTFTYTPFGEIETETQGSQTIIYHRDVLGRIKRIEDSFNGTIEYWFDGPGSIGRLSAAKNDASGIVTRYEYSSMGAIAAKSWTVGKANYTAYRKYDSVGRVSTIGYPTHTGPPVEVTLRYGKFGQLVQALGPDKTPIWTIEDLDASGRFRRERLGNGLVDVTTEDPGHPGMVRTLETLRGTSHVRQHSYRRDKIGRLIEDRDLVHKANSIFDYDHFGRLARLRLIHGAQVSSIFHYDDTGNLLSRENIGWAPPSLHLAYGGGAGPHAITSCELGTYTYNDRGEQVTRPNMIVTPQFGGLPANIERTDVANSNLSMAYDAGLNRTITDDSAKDLRRINLDGLFESASPIAPVAGGLETYLFSIAGRPVCSWNRKSKGSLSKPTYLHVDDRSSLDLVTSANGSVISEMRYDPFGQRLGVAFPPTAAAPSPQQCLDLGFAGHRNLDEWGLIDMGRRWYDPVTTRFLSPDPVVAHAYLPQSLNPYSYAMNDPVNFVDRSGLADDPHDDEEDFDPDKTLVFRFTPPSPPKPVPTPPPPPPAPSPGAKQDPKGEKRQVQFEVAPIDSSFAESKRASTRSEQTYRPSPVASITRNDDGLMGAGTTGMPSQRNGGGGGIAPQPSGGRLSPSAGTPGVHPSLDWRTPAVVLGGAALLGVGLLAGGAIIAGVVELVEMGTAAVSANWVGLGSFGLAMHHIFPQQFELEFEAIGIEIDEFCVALPEQLHNFIHADGYNPMWEQWLGEHADMVVDFEEAWEFANTLMSRFNLELEGLQILPYGSYQVISP